jgi:amino acid transporter
MNSLVMYTMKHANLVLSIGNVFSQGNESLPHTGVIARWFESQLGLPPWFIILIAAPILVSLLAFLLRLIVLSIAFRFKKSDRSRKIWRRISLYLAIFFAILGLFLIWESRVEWLAEDLSSMHGNNMAELLPYLTGFLHAILATMIMVFLIYLIQRGFRAASSRLTKLAAESEEKPYQKTMQLSSSRILRIILLGFRIIRFVLFLI